jgi:hypothetical protein
VSNSVNPGTVKSTSFSPATTFASSRTDTGHLVSCATAFAWTESWSAAQKLACRNAIVPTPLKVDESGYHIVRDPELCEVPTNIVKKN